MTRPTELEARVMDGTKNITDFGSSLDGKGGAGLINLDLVEMAHIDG